MEKIKNSEVKNFKEWCCGKELGGGCLCGDLINKSQRIICNECLVELTVRKSKIESINQELKRIKEDRVLAERALHFGFVKMNEVLTQRIKRLENGRD